MALTAVILLKKTISDMNGFTKACLFLVADCSWYSSAGALQKRPIILPVVHPDHHRPTGICSFFCASSNAVDCAIQAFLILPCTCF